MNELKKSHKDDVCCICERQSKAENLYLGNNDTAVCKSCVFEWLKETPAVKDAVFTLTCGDPIE